MQPFVGFKSILKKNGLKFIHVRFIPNFLNTFLVRISRIAPSIGGRIQIETNYLPDRMFKNILLFLFTSDSKPFMRIPNDDGFVFRNPFSEQVEYVRPVGVTCEKARKIVRNRFAFFKFKNSETK